MASLPPCHDGDAGHERHQPDDADDLALHGAGREEGKRDQRILRLRAQIVEREQQRAQQEGHPQVLDIQRAGFEEGERRRHDQAYAGQRDIPPRVEADEFVQQVAGEDREAEIEEPRRAFAAEEIGRGEGPVGAYRHHRPDIARHIERPPVRFGHQHRNLQMHRQRVVAGLRLGDDEQMQHDHRHQQCHPGALRCAGQWASLHQHPAGTRNASAVVRHQYSRGRIKAAAYTDTKWTLNGAVTAVIPIQMHMPVNVATATCGAPRSRLAPHAGKQAVTDHERIEQLEANDQCDGRRHQRRSDEDCAIPGDRPRVAPAQRRRPRRRPPAR